MEQNIAVNKEQEECPKLFSRQDNLYFGLNICIGLAGFFGGVIFYDPLAFGALFFIVLILIARGKQSDMRFDCWVNDRDRTTKKVNSSTTTIIQTDEEEKRTEWGAFASLVINHPIFKKYGIDDVKLDLQLKKLYELFTQKTEVKNNSESEQEIETFAGSNNITLWMGLKEAYLRNYWWTIPITLLIIVFSI